jgi:hypothetical protein
MKLAIFVLKFFFISALLIVSNENLALKDSEAREQFFSYYFAWAGNFFDNARQMTAYVVKSAWLPDTSSLASDLEKTGRPGSSG